jgi:hypothetical protein
VEGEGHAVSLLLGSAGDSITPRGILSQSGESSQGDIIYH